MYCDMEIEAEINSILPKLLLVMIFITAAETLRKLYNDDDKSFFFNLFQNYCFDNLENGCGFYIETTIEFKCVVLAC